VVRDVSWDAAIEMTDDRFPPEEASTTARMRPRNAFLLVVHDEATTAKGVWDVLDTEYIVRDVTTAFDALEWLSQTTLACVVCVCGKSIRGEDFFNFVSRVSIDQAHRVVFIAASDDPDVAFLEQSQNHWLEMPVNPEELIALVRAVSTQ
jgi:DNA-binding response OmpR family regulator